MNESDLYAIGQESEAADHLMRPLCEALGIPEAFSPYEGRGLYSKPEPQEGGMEMLAYLAVALLLVCAAIGIGFIAGRFFS